MAVFASADGVPALVVARVLQGFATGSASGAGSGPAGDRRRRQRGPLINR
ncbi:hypothetical protein [Streptosporangium vulgare]